MRKQSRNISGVVVLLVVLGLWLVIWFQYRAILDWWRLRGYSPPAAIAQLAVDTTMTPQAVHDFYVNHPDLETATTFNNHCPVGSELTIVLGCYQNNQDGIFLYNVTDARLNGVEQVTAAHEMLHAAYDRLSNNEHKYVDELLEDYYKNGLHDQRLLDTMAVYRKTEPNDVVNEMHSVFGTEVANLPPALETYYKQYFTYREKIVSYATAYQGEFISRHKQVIQDDAQLKQLKSEYQADETDLQKRSNELKILQNEMNADMQNGQFEVYNAFVPTYNTKVNAYNAEVMTTKQLIVQYNQLVATRNNIAVEEQQLNQAIDSQRVPIANR